MNTLDIILLGILFIFVLSGKYSGFYLQINRLLSLTLSLLITKLFLYKLIVILYPIIGLSDYTKPLVYYLSIIIFYILIKFILTIFLYRYEPSKKNRVLDSVLGMLIAIINTVLILALMLSVLFNSIEINPKTINKLKEAVIFNSINTIKIIFIDYEK